MRRHPGAQTPDSPDPVLSKARRLLFLLLPLFAALTWGPEALWAQTLQELGTGDRIQVTPSEGTPLKGAFQALSPEGLTILDARAGAFTIPVESIRALELAAGRKRGKAAIIGGAVGLVAGVILGGLTSGDCVGDCGDPYGIDGGGLAEANATAEGAVLGGLVLGGLGAAVGAIFFAPERWVRVNLGPAR
jgi:hypothetical protein